MSDNQTQDWDEEDWRQALRAFAARDPDSKADDVNALPTGGEDKLRDLPGGGSVIQEPTGYARLVDRGNTYANTPDTQAKADDLADYKRYLALTGSRGGPEDHSAPAPQAVAQGPGDYDMRQLLHMPAVKHPSEAYSGEPDLLTHKPGRIAPSPSDAEPDADPVQMYAQRNNLIGDDTDTKKFLDTINKDDEERREFQRKNLIERQQKAMAQWTKDVAAAHKAGQPAPPPPTILQPQQATQSPYERLSEAQKTAVAQDRQRDQGADQDRKALDAWAEQAAAALKAGKEPPPKPRVLERLDQGGEPTAQTQAAPGNEMGEALDAKALGIDPGLFSTGVLAPAAKPPANAPPVQIDNTRSMADPQAPRLPGAGTPQGFANALAGVPDAAPTSPGSAPQAAPSQPAAPTPAPQAPQGPPPLTLPPQQYVPGGTVNTLPPGMLNQAKDLSGSRMEHAGETAKDLQTATDAYRQGLAVRTGQMAAMRDAADQEVRQQQARVAQAQDYFAKADREAQIARVDPSHFWADHGGAVGAMVAGIGAALGAAGATLGHTPNFALETINKAIDNDMRAQELNLNNKNASRNSALARLRDETGDLQSAKSLFRQAALQEAGSQLDELGTNYQTAAIKQALNQAQDAEKQKFWALQANTTVQVPGRMAGGVPKEVKDLAAKLQLESKGTLSPEESVSRAARTLGYNFGGSTGGPWDKAGLATGPGRSAGVQVDIQQQLSRIQQFKEQAQEALAAVKSGGKLDPARTGDLGTLRDAMASELGYINAGKSPNETELATAYKMLPNDFNSFQVTGSDAARLERVIKIAEAKEAHLRASMHQVGGGAGFDAPDTTDEAASKFGATERE